ncbi:MAG: IS5 family transposase [Chloroflexota bacterium]|nr:IS5 family transposase [Chloroflexota bacterium]
MAKKLVTDELWEVIEPLLPEEPPKPKGGRPRVDDRAALTGILFVLKSGIPWEMLPQEMGCGSGMTCWRRLKEWHEAGVWEELHRILLDRLGKADEIDWERASLDSASVPAPGGGQKTGKNPTDKGKSGSKRHLVVDRSGIPLSVTHSAANVHDSKVLEEAVDAIEPIHKPRGRPRKRPNKLHADKAYDFPRCREALRTRGITPRIARRGIESSEKLGRYRWAVERTLSWVNRFRRLKVRYERREDIHQAFLDLGCALICWRYVERLC